MALTGIPGLGIVELGFCELIAIIWGSGQKRPIVLWNRRNTITSEDRHSRARDIPVIFRRPDSDIQT